MAEDFSERPGGEPQKSAGEPDVFEFAADDEQSALAEKAEDGYWRDFDGVPGKEIAAGTERSEEGDAQAAVGEGIEDAVRRGHGKEEEEKFPPRRGKARDGLEFEGDDDECPDEGEGERVRQAAMAEHVLILDAEMEEDNVEIGKDG